uniref:coiled-coil domain-containing protein 169-like isoform X2 n=1 Tax=Styela clava TaxID=7725 RepID=UPI0019395A62|nr:coiled-coil domain-containing protein 169-like isoform X2 [Styela clava]
MGDSGENAASANVDEAASNGVNLDNYDVDWLMAEIAREREMTEMLDQSVGELKGTVVDLDKQLQTIDNEGSEWRVRCETQAETNQELQRQIDELKEKMRQARATKTRDNKMTDINAKDLDDHSEAGLNLLVKKLEKEKFGIESQLRDIEWRLDQESKAYYKASEAKKKYATELNQASILLNSYERMQKADVALSPVRKSQVRRTQPRKTVPVKLPEIKQRRRQVLPNKNIAK